MTRKALVNLPIQAGVYTEETERGAQGFWYRADKVRFRRGLPEKIGGWVKRQPQFKGTCRRLHDWISLDGKQWTAIATELKLYLWQNETLYDITPIRSSGTLTDPFTTVSGSNEVTVSHVAHGGQVGDFVRFFNAEPVGGIVIDGEYQIATADTDSYTIVHSEAATSSDSGGGTVAYEYDISTGASTSTTATGYGTGPYGREGYGNARTGSRVVLPLRTWSLDNWGEDLLASYAGGGIYWWDRTSGTSARAQLIANAPQINQYMIISQKDRQVFALGAFDEIAGLPDPLLIRWNSIEDLNDWTPTDTNTAGDIRLYRGSRIITAIRARLEMLVFTDITVHSLVGHGSGVYGQNTVGENVTIVGPNAGVAIDHRVFFMADADFYIYDGVLRVLPCTVRNYVFDNLNVDQKDKVYAGSNKLFNEVWWFYPSRHPDAWVQQDFTLGLPSGWSLATVSEGGTRGYVYVFNSAGYVHALSTGEGGGGGSSEVTENFESYELGGLSDATGVTLGDWTYLSLNAGGDQLSIVNQDDESNPFGTNALRLDNQGSAAPVFVTRNDGAEFKITGITIGLNDSDHSGQEKRIDLFLSSDADQPDLDFANIVDEVVLNIESNLHPNPRTFENVSDELAKSFFFANPLGTGVPYYILDFTVELGQVADSFTEDFEAYETGQFSQNITQLGDFEYITSSPAFLRISDSLSEEHGKTLRTSGSALATNFAVRRADGEPFNLSEIVMVGDQFAFGSQIITINGFFTDPGLDFDSTEPDMTNTIEVNTSLEAVAKSLNFEGIRAFSFDFSTYSGVEPHLVSFTITSEDEEPGGATVYEHDLFLTNPEAIQTPLQAEYAVELDISSTYNDGPKYAGLAFLRTDLVGDPDTTADDAKQFMVELDYDNDAIRVRKKGNDGVTTVPDNLSDSDSVSVVDLLGESLMPDRRYIIIVQVDAPRIRVWLDSTDNLAFDFQMSEQELIDFQGGTAGLHVAANPDSDASYRFYNFAASPLGVITSEEFDISPIEVNRYVAFNYEEGTWTTGRMARTAWHDKSPIMEKPYAAGLDGFLYQHETGVDADGEAMEASLRSFDMEIGEGEELMHVDQIIPDPLVLEGEVKVTVSGRRYPQAPRFTKGPYSVTPGTRKVSTRFRARQVALTVESDGTGDKWRLGQWRARAGAHGKR